MYVGIRKPYSYQIYYSYANIEEIAPPRKWREIGIGLGLGPCQIMGKISPLKAPGHHPLALCNCSQCQ